MEGPALTTTGKKKGPKKHRTSIHAERARKDQDSWKELQKKWGLEAEEKKKVRALKAPAYQPKASPIIRETGPRHPSLDNGVGVALKAPEKVYTGENMLGVAQMHKSNAVPVFQKEDAVDIARMRR
jgi:hypothetical protein